MDYKPLDLRGSIDIPASGVATRKLFEVEHVKLVVLGVGAGSELGDHRAPKSRSEPNGGKPKRIPPQSAADFRTLLKRRRPRRCSSSRSCAGPSRADRTR